jgi:muconate cycloisomerase
MKITDVRVYPVNLTVSPEFVITTTLGTHDFSHYVFVAVESSDGIIGWGEATVVPRWSGESQPGALHLIKEVFEPLLLGQNVMDINRIMASIDGSVIDNSFSKSAIEMALLDLQGKTLDLPVYQLLGGAVNSRRIPIKFSIGLRTPENAAKIAKEKVSEGFQAIKVKVGPDLKSDIERVKQVREAIGPAVKLNIDVNGGWTTKQAIQYIPKFQEYNLEYVEQPTPRWDLDGMAQVRHHVDVPIMADESVFTVEQALQVIRKDAADLISVYPGKNGGILKSRLISQMAEAAGIACHIGSNLEWDIATSAMCHLAVCTGNIQVTQYPVDILGPLYYRTRLADCPVKFGDGFVHVPDGAGFGLKVNEARIQELSRRGVPMVTEPETFPVENLSST